MKIEPAVLAETKKVAAGTAVMTALMIAVFLILRKFDYTVILGALLGAATAVGNFFLLALTVQHLTGSMPVLPRDEEEKEEEEGKADEAEEEKPRPLSPEATQAGRKMQLSFLLRLLLIGLVALIAVKTPWFHPAASLVPLLFPNIVISIMKIKAGRGA